ncbi:type II toxin-antitoxin system Phd/YefM family antitoxin, partial [Megasphaera massiliensis]
MDNIDIVEVMTMKIISQRDARKDFFKIAQEVNERSIPVMVAGKDSMDDVVILAKADYDALMETLHLYGVPGMAEKLSRAEKEAGIPFTSL